MFGKKEPELAPVPVSTLDVPAGASHRILGVVSIQRTVAHTSLLSGGQYTELLHDLGVAGAQAGAALVAGVRMTVTAQSAHASWVLVYGTAISWT